MDRERLQELARFCVAGATGAAVEFSLLYVLTEFCGVYYLYSAGVAFVTAVVLNYYMCAVYVFRGAKGMSARQTAAFFLTSVVGLGLNQAGMWFLVEICGIYYMTAKVITTGAVTAWNYVTKRYALNNF